jgi:hypothetical protein
MNRDFSQELEGSANKSGLSTNAMTTNMPTRIREAGREISGRTRKRQKYGNSIAVTMPAAVRADPTLTIAVNSNQTDTPNLPLASSVYLSMAVVSLVSDF